MSSSHVRSERHARITALRRVSASVADDEPALVLRGTTRGELCPADGPDRPKLIFLGGAWHIVRAPFWLIRASPGSTVRRAEWTTSRSAGRDSSLIGKGAVLAHRFNRPLATEMDEYEQRPTRDAGRMLAAPLTSGRLHRPGAHARSMVERGVRCRLTLASVGRSRRDVCARRDDRGSSEQRERR
jgi:hypothetical protein